MSSLWLVMVAAALSYSFVSHSSLFVSAYMLHSDARNVISPFPIRSNDVLSALDLSPMVPSPRRRCTVSVHASSKGGDNRVDRKGPVAFLCGVDGRRDDVPFLQRTLASIGFVSVTVEDNTHGSPSSNPNDGPVCRYTFSKATGMLRLVNSSNSSFDPPRWVPLVDTMETVLVANGWSFLDMDNTEPLSSYDIDAANIESTYVPKWGRDFLSPDHDLPLLRISELGYDLTPLTHDQTVQAANSLLDASQQPDDGAILTRRTLLEGATDPPNLKRTHDGTSFQGPIGENDLLATNRHGIFTCAIGGLPLFSTLHLSLSTATSGWLSFQRPVSDDHVLLVPPLPGEVDSRTEVLCAKTRCHLGHYFGERDGYCINASALCLVRSGTHVNHGGDCAGDWSGSPNDDKYLLRPISYRNFDLLPLSLAPSSSTSSPMPSLSFSPSQQSSHLAPVLNQLRAVLYRYQHHRGRSSSSTVRTILLGAGCFWHVEAALRRLPGVLDTTTGYARGCNSSNNNKNNNNIPPTYETVGLGGTEYAEVVRVTYDTKHVGTKELIECFLAMHDATKVKALGDYGVGGRYRSCVFVKSRGREGERGRVDDGDDSNNEEGVVRRVLEECSRQLGKELCTQVVKVVPRHHDGNDDHDNDDVGNVFEEWFYRAEDTHQRYQERKAINEGQHGANDTSTLSLHEWLALYGNRSRSIIGSAESMPVE